MNIIFDAHCDTLQKACDFDSSLRKNGFQLDLERLNKRKAKSIQVFAAFIDKVNDKKTPYQRCMQLLNKYNLECELNSDIVRHCNCLKDINDALSMNKIASILSIEGGEALEGHINNLDKFYAFGVRFLTLCWNYRNEIADGVIVPDGKGLTEFGKLVVKRMNDIGMVVDVSHISEAGFWDVIECSKQPISATHSNVKSLRNHPRNLSDDQIKAIIKQNGCIGINIYPEFVSDDSCNTIDIIRHIEYVMALGGEDSIGLGSDFDGIDRLPQEWDDVNGLEQIFDELLRLGYSERLVKKLAWENFIRLFEHITQ